MPRRLPIVGAASVVGLALAAGGLLGMAWHAPALDGAGVVATGSSATAPSTTAAPTPSAVPDSGLTIVAAGEVLVHAPVARSARVADGYDFTPLLTPFDAWVQGADLALCHVEAPTTPPGTQPSGYPVFAMPPAIVTALAAQGWDGCSTASNHAVDRGFAGVTATLDALDAAGLGHTGTARSPQEDTQPQLYRFHRAGRTVTIAHLAFTYGTNGMPVDADKPWSVDLADPAAIVARARTARLAGADLVLVSLHGGAEYVTTPTDWQRAVVTALADSGQVDVVLGHHAHVPQPVEHVPGGPRGQGMWVAYGMGNLLTNQDEACCPPATAAGVLLTVHAHVPGDPARPVAVSDAQWTATTVDRRGGHRLYAIDDVTGGTATLSAATVAQRHDRVAQAVGVQAMERTTPAQPTGPGPQVLTRP